MKLFCYNTENMVCELADMTKSDASEKLQAQDENGNIIKYFNKPVFGKITLDYPLTTPYKMEVNEVKTVGELMWLISQAYVVIYETEDETATAMKEWDDPNIINRGKTNGDYGIWGHSICELVIEEIEIKNNKISVFIGS